MQNILGSRSSIALNTRAFNKFKYLQEGVAANLAKVTEFYRHYPSRLPSSSPLLKLLYSLPAFTGDPQRYYDIVADREEQLANALKFTSPINVGSVTNGVLYTVGVNEILISVEANEPEWTLNFDLANWETVEPIQVLVAPTDDLTLSALNGRNDLDLDHRETERFAVITVNIPLLAVQYMEWRKRNLTGTPAQFLYSYPLANAVRTQTNCVFWNRLFALDSGRPMVNTMNRPVLQIIKYEKQIDSEYTDILELIYSNRMDVADILANVPLSSGTVLRDHVPTMGIVETRQVYWAIFAAYAPLLEFLLNTRYINQNSSDSGLVKDLKREFRSIRSDRLLDVTPNALLRAQLKARFETLQGLID